MSPPRATQMFPIQYPTLISYQKSLTLISTAELKKLKKMRHGS